VIYGDDKICRGVGEETFSGALAFRDAVFREKLLGGIGELTNWGGYLLEERSRVFPLRAPEAQTGEKDSCLVDWTTAKCEWAEKTPD